jgi:predicted transglutaminase-like cysteine proteinase
LFGLAGAPPASADPVYSYFETPTRSDPWSPKIAGWQLRERKLVDVEKLRSPAPVSDSGARKFRLDVAEAGELRSKYFEFRAEQKRELAREVAAWIQAQARRHYAPDGAFDHWATLAETLATNGDDCDGLELLTYHFLRDMGFREDEVYRAIVHRPEDGQHHMVTLWFESPADPWVIDPTGAMTDGMPRMSEVPGWEPLKVFSENREFSAREARHAKRDESPVAADASGSAKPR